jgi:hypothetical protein
MTLEINPDNARERIDEFLEQIDELLEKDFREGKEKKKKIETKLDNFAEVAFSDGKKKKNSLYPAAAVITTKEKSPGEKQQDYEESLKRKKRQLEAWKDQIELEEEVASGGGSEDNEYREIKEEISKIDETLPIFADDLSQSLEELRNSHFLASTLITGRVVDYTIDQIKSSQRLGDPEEVLDHLEEENIVDTRESAITNVIKSYRDEFTHEVGKTPEATEAFILLMGCAKLLHNIQQAGKTREYDLA